MIVCPNCGAEYRSGFTQCSDCGVELVERKASAEHKASADPVRSAPGLLFPILWTAATVFAFYRGAVHGYAASLGAGPVVFFVFPFVGALCGLFQSPLIFWGAKSVRVSLVRSILGAVTWMVVSPIAWAVAVPVGYGAGASMRGIPGIVLGVLLSGGIIGIFQWPIVRIALKRMSGPWIPINIVAFAAALGGSALWGTLNSTHASSPDANIVQSLIAIGPVFGVITGFSLWWILRSR